MTPPHALESAARKTRPVRPLWSGLLTIDKSTGMTSHDVVDHVRRRLRVETAGHLGTLDPAASGLLVVAIGAATRCAMLWQKGDKTYQGSLRLGVVTDTQDMTGQVLEQRPVDVGVSEVRQASLGLTGEIEQIPPMVSALKHGGERLYRLARRGLTVERSPRRVRVTEWEWLSFSLPEAQFTICCSSGTYVRTLVHDLGARLETGAALQSLRRLRSEPFGLDHAVSLHDLDQQAPEDVLAAHGITLSDALSEFPSLRLEAAAAERIGHGAPVVVSRAQLAMGGAPIPMAAGPRSVVFRDAAGELLALGELRPNAADGVLLAWPQLVFPWARSEGGS